MNQPVVIRASLPAGPTLSISETLQSGLIAAEPTETRPRGTPLLPDERAEAVALLAHSSVAVSEPANLRVIELWLAPVVLAVSNPPTRDDMRGRCGAVAMACEDLPGWVFSTEAQRVGVKRWKFWPSAADVRAVVEECAKPTLDRIEALRRAVAASHRHEDSREASKAAQTPELTPEQRAEISRNLRQELAKARPPDPPPNAVRAGRVLSRETLNEMYREAGIPGPKVSA